jgi:putative solute:sodium symporter small subunit
LTVLGFPLHYFLLIMLSWIGATIVGAIWCIVMDRLEEKQRV